MEGGCQSTISWSQRGRAERRIDRSGALVILRDEILRVAIFDVAKVRISSRVGCLLPSGRREFYFLFFVNEQKIRPTSELQERMVQRTGGIDRNGSGIERTKGDILVESEAQGGRGQWANARFQTGRGRQRANNKRRRNRQGGNE